MRSVFARFMNPSEKEWPYSTSAFKPRDSKDNPPADSVGIVIPMKDGVKFFKLCFHSVLSFMDYQHMIAVVDNQCRFDTRSYLKAITKNHALAVLRYDEDFNFAAQVNLAMRYFFRWPTIKYGLILNADAVVSPEWLSKMVATIKSHDSIGIVGPVSNMANPEQMELERRRNYTAALRVSGFCMLFKREVWEQLGGFDEEFLGGGFEDWDFCERALRKNWKIVIDGFTHIHHFYKMFRREDSHNQQMLANEKRFFMKHPMLVDYVEKKEVATH